MACALGRAAPEGRGAARQVGGHPRAGAGRGQGLGERAEPPRARLGEPERERDHRRDCGRLPESCGREGPGRRGGRGRTLEGVPRGEPSYVSCLV